jgi:ubiquinone/menaquinone biosynthesis C-methylase UbiE
VDPSPKMLRQARKRNAAAIKSGLVELCVGSVESLPCKDQQFDKVLSVNNVMLWPGPGQSLREVRRVMKPGGDLVIALNPRRAKTVQDVEDMGREIIDHISSAGFPQAEMELRPDLKPAGAVTVLARAPNPN